MTSGIAFDALGFDPAPGDPYGVEQLASTVRRVGEELTSARDELRAVGRTGGVWQGRSADAFAGQLEKLPEYLDRASTSTWEAMRALTSWRYDLEAFQDQARAYERRAAEARSSVARAQSAVAGLPDDLSQLTGPQLAGAQREAEAARQTLQVAQQELEAILAKAHALFEDYQARAGQVAATVRAAADHAPPEPSFWATVTDWMTPIDDIAAIATAAIDAIHEWVKEHAQLLKFIGDLCADLSFVCGMLAFVPLPGFRAFGVAAAVLSGAAMVSHGLAKWGGAKVGWGTIAMDALGAVPLVGRIPTGKALNVGDRLGQLTSKGMRMMNTADVGQAFKGLGLAGTGKTVDLFLGGPLSREIAEQSSSRFVHYFNDTWFQQRQMLMTTSFGGINSEDIPIYGNWEGPSSWTDPRVREQGWDIVEDVAPAFADAVTR